MRAARRRPPRPRGRAGATSRARAGPAAAGPDEDADGREPQGRARGSRRFIAESWGELKKVEWPTQSHVIQGTLVVLIACIIVGTYIWVCDIVFKNLVQDIFLRA